MTKPKKHCWEIQTLFTYGWENVIREDAGIHNPEGTLVTFKTRKEAREELNDMRRARHLDPDAYTDTRIRKVYEPGKVHQ